MQPALLGVETSSFQLLVLRRGYDNERWGSFFNQCRIISLDHKCRLEAGQRNIPDYAVRT